MKDRVYNGVAGVVVAGGLSRRMGCDKALISWHGKPLISYPLNTLSRFFREVIIVTRNVNNYKQLGFPVFGDATEKRGSIVGLLSGLSAISEPDALFTACDMPFISGDLVKMLVFEMDPASWAVVPESPNGLEPLLAIYSKRCLPAISELIDSGDFRISSLFSAVPTKFVSASKIKAVDPDFRSFANINTPEDLKTIKPPVVNKK